MKVSEHQEQALVVAWFDLQYPQYKRLFWATPNGGDRHPVVAAKLKAEGVRAGVSDLVLAVARNGMHGLFIEMKAIGGRVSVPQKEFIEEVRAQGYGAAVCYGFDEAKRVIREYLG